MEEIERRIRIATPWVLDVVVAYSLVGVALAWSLAANSSESQAISSTRLSNLVGLFVLLAIDDEGLVLRNIYRKWTNASEQDGPATQSLFDWSTRRKMVMSASTPVWTHPLTWIEAFQRVLLTTLILTIACTPILNPLSTSVTCVSSTETVTAIVCAEPENVYLTPGKTERGVLWDGTGYGSVDNSFSTWSFNATKDVIKGREKQHRWIADLSGYDIVNNREYHSWRSVFNQSTTITFADFIPTNACVLEPILDPAVLGAELQHRGVNKYVISSEAAFQVIILYRNQCDFANETVLKAQVINYGQYMADEMSVSVKRFLLNEEVTVHSKWAKKHVQHFISSVPGQEATVATGADFAGFKMMLSGNLTQDVLFKYSKFISADNRTLSNVDRSQTGLGYGEDDRVCYKNYKRKGKYLVMMYGPLREWNVEVCTYTELLSGGDTELTTTFAIMLTFSMVLFASVIAWAMCSKERGKNLWISTEIFGGLQGRLLGIAVFAEAVYVTSAYHHQSGKSNITLRATMWFSGFSFFLFGFWDIYFVRRYQTSLTFTHRKQETDEKERRIEQMVSYENIYPECDLQISGETPYCRSDRHVLPA